MYLVVFVHQKCMYLVVFVHQNQSLADLTARDELVYTSKCSEYNTYAIPQPKGAQPFSSSEFAALCKKSWNSMPWNEKGMLPVVTIKGKNEPMRVEWIRFAEDLDPKDVDNQSIYHWRISKHYIKLHVFIVILSVYGINISLLV
eukprot:247148_1